jgi:hypothetical protein
MREITMPEVKLPDIKLPDGLREMSRDDIVHAAQNLRIPNVDLPSRLELPDIDLSKVELPRRLTDRLPGRRRANPMLPIAGIVALGAAIAGVWWLFTSSLTGPRLRSAVKDLRQRVTGERSGLVRYDNEQDLESLLADGGNGHSSMGSEPWPTSTVPADAGNGVPVGPGNLPEGVGRPG